MQKSSSSEPVHLKATICFQRMMHAAMTHALGMESALAYQMVRSGVYVILGIQETIVVNVSKVKPPINNT